MDLYCISIDLKRCFPSPLNPLLSFYSQVAFTLDSKKSVSGRESKIKTEREGCTSAEHISGRLSPGGLYAVALEVEPEDFFMPTGLDCPKGGMIWSAAHRSIIRPLGPMLRNG